MPTVEEHVGADGPGAARQRNSRRRTVPSTPGDKKVAPRRFHAFKITQYLHHPDSGEALLTPAQLQAGLSRRSITKWAWAEHDQDRGGDGNLIPPHWHIAVQCKDARSREQIAEWFGVPLQLVRVLGGRGGFASYLRCLTHGDPTTGSPM
ncbi:Rep family protein [Arthrobacter sp. NPDC092385]|uniref:Rep family protein n=1 Tax=Arthrobacter sp. NPDC092385 TaxID=3363943 RepID=UPI0037FD1330